MKYVLSRRLLYFYYNLLIGIKSEGQTGMDVAQIFFSDLYPLIIYKSHAIFMMSLVLQLSRSFAEPYDSLFSKS